MTLTEMVEWLKENGFEMDIEDDDGIWMLSKHLEDAGVRVVIDKE